MTSESSAQPAPQIDNRLNQFREAKGLSRAELAERACVTRQAIHAIETGQYLPTTAVALQLARVLDCRVEDLFRLTGAEEVVEGVFALGQSISDSSPRAKRVKVARVGARYIVRPVVELGEVLNYTVPADGLLLDESHLAKGAKGRVRVQLLRDRRIIEQEIAVAGCDPSIFLLGDYLRRYKESCTVVGWTLGSTAALEALKRREVHIAGVHVVDASSGESNLPYIRRHLKGTQYLVMTFAIWEEGLLLSPGNPRGIRDISDLARRDVTLVNREAGAGARLLLDQRLAPAGIPPIAVRGYGSTARSHVHVARMIAEGHADVAVGVRAAAQLFGLDFLPLQQARYDLVVPKAYLSDHPGIESLLDILTSRPFRTEIEALGGYDTREMGTVRQLVARR